MNKLFGVERRNIMKWSEESAEYVFKGKSEADLVKMQTDCLALAKCVEELSTNGDHRFDRDLPSYRDIAENAGIAASQKRREH
jgi:hypothetical protein